MTTECPTCGEDKFSCEQSMKSHHKQAHGESIAGRSVNCENCNKEKSVLPTYYEQFDRFFCDEQCRGEWRSENMSGEDSWHYEKVSLDCSYCGDDIEKQPYMLERSSEHFCSRECQSKWQSESGINTGKNSPLWKGGGRYYGPNWPQVRKEIRERDNQTCQNCGIEFDEYESGPAVHHIKKLRDFDTYKEANKRENLVSLCQSCHMELEELPVDEQIERVK